VFTHAQSAAAADSDTINLINSKLACRDELLPVAASMRSVSVTYWLPVYARASASEVLETSDSGSVC